MEREMKLIAKEAGASDDQVQQVLLYVTLIPELFSTPHFCFSRFIYRFVFGFHKIYKTKNRHQIINFKKFN